MLVQADDKGNQTRQMKAGWLYRQCFQWTQERELEHKNEQVTNISTYRVQRKSNKANESKMTLPSKNISSTVSSCTTTRNRQHRNVYPTARRSKAGSTILFISNPFIAYIWRVELVAEATRCSTPFPMSSNPVGISANQRYMHTIMSIW